MVRRIFPISGFVAVLLLALTVHPVRAVTIVPPSLEFGVEPGQKVETSVKLFNESPDAVVLFPTTSNFTAKDENGTPDFDPLGKPIDLAGWIKVGVGPYNLAPNEHLEVPVTISVPADADPGGHYAALFFGNQADTSKAAGGVAIASKIGVLVILRVEGQINETATVSKWGVKGKTRVSHQPVTFQAEIQNTGNIHVRPTGTVIIHNMFGGQTATIVFNPSRGAVLPSSARLFDLTWQKGTTTDKPGNFFQEVASEWRNFAWGTYTASLSVTYGSNLQSLAADTRFTVFPWQLLLVLLIGLIIVVTLFVMGIRHYNAMIIKRAGQTVIKP